MHDADALHDYVSSASPEAFESLVHAHIDLVYTAACRQTRDPHMADDVTQAVFVVLAKKAKTIRDATLLPGWLVRTTRYAAYNATRIAARRRHHESQAAAMNATLAASEESSDLSELLPALDEHLARLSDADRTAVVLRFFHDKPMRDIATALNVSEVAAQKRVVRAVEKLRSLFARQGRATSAESLTAALTGIPMLHAPTTLAPKILSSTIAPNASAIAQAAIKSMFWTGAKLAAAVIASLIIAATGSAVLLNNRSVAASPAVQQAAPAPSKLANAAPATKPAGSKPAPPFPNAMMGAKQGDVPGYAHGVDDTVKRTSDSDPAAMLMAAGPKPANMGVSHFLTPAAPYRGQRVRISAYLKTADLVGWAGLSVYAITPDGHIYASDNSATRGIRGTSEWKRYESIIDVSPKATTLMFGVCLCNIGTVWADGFNIERVGKDVPLTDDTLWHSFSWRGVYAHKPDPNTRRNNQPTTMFSSTATDIGINEFGLYDYAIRDIDQFRGKRVKVTMWLKCENVTAGSGPHLHIVGADFKQLANDGQRGHRPLKGTMDWAQYEAIAEVPKETDAVYPGITLNGSGKIWVDEVKVELLP